MNSSRIGIGLLALGLATADSSRADDGPDRKKGSPSGVAVVELFTSEGCSSCPDADRELSAMRERARQDGTAIYPVAFHVDYWNRLGWTDRFSSAEASARQREYAATFGQRGSYTPQMIVNGGVEFVGSDVERANREIDRALAALAKVTPEISLAARKSLAPITIDVRCPSAPGGAQICAVVTEDGLSNAVKTGENAGRTLKHDAVARTFKVLLLGDQNKCTVTLNPPADLKEANASVLVFVQEPKSMRVLGAVALPLIAKPQNETAASAEPTAPTSKK